MSARVCIYHQQSAYAGIASIIIILPLLSSPFNHIRLTSSFPTRMEKRFSFLKNCILLYPKACTLWIEDKNEANPLEICSNSGCTSCKTRAEMAIRQHQKATEEKEGQEKFIDEFAFLS